MYALISRISFAYNTAHTMLLRTVLINRPNAGLFGLMFNQVCINVSNDAGPYRFTAPNTPLLIMYRISYYSKTSNREPSNGGTYSWYGTISLVPTYPIDLSKIPVTEQFFIRNKKSGPEPVPYLEFLLYVLQTLTHTNHCITFVQKFPCVENFYVSNTCAFLSATHVVKVCAPVTQLH